MRVGFLVQWYIGRGFWFEAFGFLVVTVDGDVANDIAFGPISPTTFAEMATLRKVVVVELGVKRVAVRALQDGIETSQSSHTSMCRPRDVTPSLVLQPQRSQPSLVPTVVLESRDSGPSRRHGRGRAKEGRVRASSSLDGLHKLPNASSGRQQVRKSVGDHDSQDDELLGSPMQVLHED
ncbi:hypothetical protein LOK49_Contig146G00004 [Camellia lanceoleosa]|nr:hypothetical protein LOK49_Contig146G00004 [Camellia lanceoleosa]